MHKKINTENAPKAIGPYSQATVIGDFVFTSGQIAINPETNELVGNTIKEQTHMVCRNLKAILAAAGSSLDMVIKCVCYLSDIADFASFNQVYSEYFTNKPARSCVAVKDLPKGALVEIEVVAEKGKNEDDDEKIVIDGLETLDFSKEGYKRTAQFENWVVATMAYSRQNDERYSNYIERHMKTDEVLILFEGEATLIIGMEMHRVQMEKNKIYNVKRGVWHTVILKEDAKVIVVENSNTSKENSEYYYYK